MMPRGLRSFLPEGRDDRIRITRVRRGYAHTEYEGECDESVTAEDIRRLFFHPMFGGRAIALRAGRFRVIRHED